MKSAFQHTLLLFLATAMLASSTGITIFKMVCGSSGKEMVSLTEINNCCENKNQESARLEKKCCDFSSQTFKLSLLHKTEFKTISFYLPASPEFFALPRIIESHKINSHLFCGSSHTKTGREILCCNSTFLI